MKKTHEEREDKEQETDVQSFSAHTGNEYVKTLRDGDVPDANAVRARLSWDSDEVGESDI